MQNVSKTNNLFIWLGGKMDRYHNWWEGDMPPYMAQVFTQHWYVPSLVQNYVKQTNTSRSHDI